MIMNWLKYVSNGRKSTYDQKQKSCSPVRFNYEKKIVSNPLLGKAYKSKNEHLIVLSHLRLKAIRSASFQYNIDTKIILNA